MSEAISTALKPEAFKGETTRTGAMRVVCSGPQFSKHPQVYLTMVDDASGHPDHVVCPYCSHTFLFDATLAKPGAGHH